MLLTFDTFIQLIKTTDILHWILTRMLGVIRYTDNCIGDR